MGELILLAAEETAGDRVLMVLAVIGVLVGVIVVLVFGLGLLMLIGEYGLAWYGAGISLLVCLGAYIAGAESVMSGSIWAFFICIILGIAAGALAG